MSLQSVLLPLFVQVALTFVLMFSMGGARLASVRRGETKIRDIALGEPNWPPRVRQIGNCFRNQFELPVLFYVLVILAWNAHKADLAFVVLAWVFVLLRIVHAAIHVGTNYVPHRFYAYLAGAVVLLAMWMIFAARILIGL